EANPRGRPVARSIIRLASTTDPCAAKASCRSFSVMSKERFPTNNFVLMQSRYLLAGLALSRLFPRIGFQIVSEPSSPEDFHDRKSDKLPKRRMTFDRFAGNSKRYSHANQSGIHPISRPRYCPDFGGLERSGSGLPA